MSKRTLCNPVIGLLILLSGSVAHASLFDGLTGYWPLDELSAEDASGNGLDGTIVGIVDAVSDRFGSPEGAMLFEGFAEDYVDLGDVEPLRMTGPMTVAAWVVLDGGNVNNGRIVSKSGAGGNRSWSLNIESGNSDPTFQVAIDGNTNLSVRDVDPLPTDEWVHMVGIYRPGEQAEIYVNGQLKEILEDDIPDSQFSDNGLPVLIGARNQCNNCGWMGSIDDVAIWNRSLDSDEVTDLFENGLSPPMDGDFDANGELDFNDIDQLTWQSASGTNLSAFDLNQDSLVNELDIQTWINDLFGSWMGDADLNGEFHSGDLVQVLASGTYEVDVESVWSTGDFSGDGRTNSGDLVVALAGGGYEQGPRVAAAVPEPMSSVLVITMMLPAILFSTKRRRRGPGTAHDPTRVC